MRRQLLVSLVGTALAVTVAAPALADTSEPAEAHDVFSSGVDFTFTDRDGIDWEGFASVEDNRTSGVQFVSFYFAGRGTETTVCDGETPDDPSDDYEDSSYIEFFSTDGRAVTDRIATDLSQAKVHLKLSGTRVVLAPCTGELIASTTERHTFEYDIEPVTTPNPTSRPSAGLTATGAASSSPRATRSWRRRAPPSSTGSGSGSRSRISRTARTPSAPPAEDEGPRRPTLRGGAPAPLRLGGVQEGEHRLGEHGRRQEL